MKSTIIPDLCAGASKLKITPTEPVPLAGFYDRQGLSEGVHDDLFVRTVVFESEGVEAVVISLDICILTNPFWEDMIDKIGHAFPLTKRRVFMNATHTHGGPAVADPEGQGFMDISFLNPNPHIELQRRFTESLKETILESIRVARGIVRPSRIGFATGSIDIGVNRREESPEGKAVAGVNPSGPVDRNLHVIKIDTLDGDTVALLYNNGAHGVSMMTREMTGDWPGLASQEIEAALGGDAVAAYISGAAGDVNPVYRGVKSFDSPYGTAQDLARTVKDEVMTVAEGIVPEYQGPIIAQQREMTLPGKRYLGLIGFDPAYDELAKDLSPAPPTELRMTALRIGELLIAGVNAEVFCEIGMEFKEKSPFDNSFFAGNTNGYQSYVLTDSEIARGGYEYNASLITEGGHRAIVDTLLDMAGELRE